MTSRIAPLPGSEGLPLLSEEAAALYQRLLQAGPQPIKGDARPSDAALRELLDRHFAMASTTAVSAVEPERALRLALASWRDETAQSLDRLLVSAAALERLQELWEQKAGPAGKLVTLLTDPDVIGSVSADLTLEAKRDVLTFSTESTRHKPASVVPPAGHLVDQGVRFKAVWETACWERPEGPANLARCLRAGSHIRLTPKLPMKMVLVDDLAALVPLTPIGSDAALLIRSHVLVGALRELFEMHWEDAVPCPGSSDELGTDQVSDVGRTILRLLAAEVPDAAIARRLGMSDRTLRRHVSSLQRELNVSTRFALARAAMRRRWLE